jgi:hypothetical protein
MSDKPNTFVCDERIPDPADTYVQTVQYAVETVVRGRAVRGGARTGIAGTGLLEQLQPGAVSRAARRTSRERASH